MNEGVNGGHGRERDVMTNLARADMIEGKIDRAVAGSIGVNSDRGLAISSMGEAMEFAKLMSVSDVAVPKHLRQNPGACLAIAVQGFEWGINPFALANKSYVVNDRIAYESAMYHTVLMRRAPIQGRIKMEYAGDGPSRTCRVFAKLAEDGEIVEYTSPKFSTIITKNSPQWKYDPDQQLFYFSVRAFARRHFPDVMMGVYTVDELDDARPAKTIPDATERLNARIVASRPASEGQTIAPDPDAEMAIAAQDAHDGDIIDAATGDVMNESPATDDSAVPEQAVDLSTWEKTLSALNEAAIDANVTEDVLRRSVGAWLLARGAKGKEDAKTTTGQRQELLDAFRCGRLGIDGKIVPA